MLTKRYLLMTLLLAALAYACSDDNGGDNDSGPDMPVATDGTPDAPLPDLPPPDMDTSKTPVIEKMIPVDGFANATTRVLITGKNFVQGARILVDGGAGDIIMSVSVSSPVSLSFVMPKNPYGAPNYDQPQKVSVAVMVNQLVSNSMDFQYTVTKEMDAKFKGSVVTASTSSFNGFLSDPVQGKVFLEGVTDSTTGDSTKIKAQVGYGTMGLNPTNEDGWKWTDAPFKTDDGTYDVYAAQLKVPLAQTYDVAFRFSQDNGQSWVYADTDETNLAYETAKAAKITATQAPPNYCQVDLDCVVNPYAVKCKVDKADKTKNQCVECFADTDCSDYAKSLGQFCDVPNAICYCKDKSECAGNPNGLDCLGAGKLTAYCGCNSDTDCTAPATCTQDPNTGLQICQ